MNRFNFIKNIFIFSILALLIACSSETQTEDAPIDIKSLNANYVEDRAPKENDFQIEIELLGSVSDANLKQDIYYEWYVEYIKLDIDKNANPLENIEQDDETNDVKILVNNDKYLEGYYFLDVSKNALTAMVSIYVEGFYKVTLQASNENETKDYSIILKIGEPKLPHLFTKVNIPAIEKVKPEDFKGSFYLTLGTEKNDNRKIHKLNANKMMDDWLDTDITIDPFKSFSFITGTHIIDNKSKTICSLSNCDLSSIDPSISYSINDYEPLPVTISPILLKDLTNSITISLEKSKNQIWSQGNIYLSYLLWGLNEEKKDEFTFFEELLNNENPKITTEIINKYLAQIFIGSFGHRMILNKYYIYFGPNGTDTDEIDPKNKRDYTGLPYGYLLGKLGPKGQVFPIGNEFSYDYQNDIKTYHLNENNHFIILY